MIAGYKVWHCSYRWSVGWGTHREHDCIVVAEIESKALGMALEAYTDSTPSGWSAVEIPSDKENVQHISSSSS